MPVSSGACCKYIVHFIDSRDLFQTFIQLVLTLLDVWYMTYETGSGFFLLFHEIPNMILLVISLNLPYLLHIHLQATSFSVTILVNELCGLLLFHTSTMLFLRFSKLSSHTHSSNPRCSCETNCVESLSLLHFYPDSATTTYPLRTHPR